GEVRGGGAAVVQRRDKAQPYDHTEHVREGLRLSAAIGQQFLDGASGANDDELLLAGASAMCQHLDAAMSALAGGGSVRGVGEEADLAVGTALGILSRLQGVENPRRETLAHSTKKLMKLLEKHAGWKQGDADTMIDGATKTDVAFTEGDLKDLIGNTLR